MVLKSCLHCDSYEQYFFRLLPHSNGMTKLVGIVLCSRNCGEDPCVLSIGNIVLQLMDSEVVGFEWDIFPLVG